MGALLRGYEVAAVIAIVFAMMSLAIGDLNNLINSVRLEEAGMLGWTESQCYRKAIELL